MASKFCAVLLIVSVTISTPFVADAQSVTTTTCSSASLEKRESVVVSQEKKCGDLKKQKDKLIEIQKSLQSDKSKSGVRKLKSVRSAISRNAKQITSVCNRSSSARQKFITLVNSCNKLVTPTPTPSATPTVKVTPSPTATPQATPTAIPVPTIRPTVPPTPSAAPTVAPTAAPTALPTAAPTVTPAPTPPASTARTWVAPSSMKESFGGNIGAASQFVRSICTGLLPSAFNCSDSAGLNYFAPNLANGVTNREQVFENLASYSHTVYSKDSAPGLPPQLTNNSISRPLGLIPNTPNMVNEFFGEKVDGLYQSILGWPSTDQSTINYWLNLLNRGQTTLSDLKVMLCNLNSGPRRGCNQPVQICNGIFADNTGGVNASPAIEHCLQATPAGSLLALPPGTYLLNEPIKIARSDIGLTTAGLEKSTQPCAPAPNGVACARFLAAPDFNDSPAPGRSDTFGMIQALVLGGVVNRVTLDHIVVDGNREARRGSPAHCNGHVKNLTVLSGDGNRLTYSAVVNALGITAIGWTGTNSYIANNYIANNGAHKISTFNCGGVQKTIAEWSDGLFIGEIDRAKIENNTFVDNTDVDLIVAKATLSAIQNNQISHSSRISFAGLMTTGIGGVSSSFAGTWFAANKINCPKNTCFIGIQIGAGPWVDFPNSIGGYFYMNEIDGAMQGINVDGAGSTNLGQVYLDRNVIRNSTSNINFVACTNRVTSAINVAPNSSVAFLPSRPAGVTGYSWSGEFNCSNPR